MCRSIKPLRQVVGQPGDEDVAAAALQYVRKVSGFHRPARINQAAFERAVAEVAEATPRLDATLARLEALGARAVNSPAQIMDGLRSVYLQDPDGNWVELDEDRVHAEAQFLIWQRTAISPAPGVVAL